MTSNPTGVTGRAQTLREEVANCITHGAGLCASIAAIPVLMFTASGTSDGTLMVGTAVFGVTLVLLYAASTLYHAVRSSRAKHVFRVLDHCAIYLLIAGTYTPFTLGPLRGPWGWTMLVIVWTLALVGVATKLTMGFQCPRLSTWLYLGMGWLVVVAIEPLAAQLSGAGLAWLIAGGVCYTGGVAFFVVDGRMKYGHTVWHLFVLAGSACHFFAVLWHAVPAVA